jgi:hypothetical protein
LVLRIIKATSDVLKLLPARWSYKIDLCTITNFNHYPTRRSVTSDIKAF